MSLQSVRAFLAEHASDLEIVEKSTSTATVAARARTAALRGIKTRSAGNTSTEAAASASPSAAAPIGERCSTPLLALYVSYPIQQPDLGPKARS